MEEALQLTLLFLRRQIENMKAVEAFIQEALDSGEYLTADWADRYAQFSEGTLAATTDDASEIMNVDIAEESRRIFGHE